MARARILIVDDEQEIRGVIEDALTAHGYAVDLAATSSAALELVRNTAYDAAIVDINLPDMNGIMLHREIRQMDQELSRHVVFISGEPGAVDKLSLLSEKTTFLPKPFSVSDLLDVLRLTVNGR